MDSNEGTVSPEEPASKDASAGNQQAMGDFMAQEDLGLDTPRRGEIRTGTIARITDSDILVDIGTKSEGLIPASELASLPAERRAALTVGSEVTVYVLRAGGGEEGILLSLARADEERDWQEVERLLETQDVYEGTISGFNKGGLIVKIGKLRAFVPASQISLSRRRRAEGDTPDRKWGKMVGEPIAVKVVEVDRKRNRLIVSERAAAKEARKLLKDRLISELKAGEVRTGHVISLADFGAFVDIGGADGLIHLSEITWKKIGHPRDLLKVGDEVRVKVLGVDPERKRISLSLRELETNPWEKLAGTVKEGQLVEGTITKLTKFGAFATLAGMEDYDLEGLIHVSELSDRRIEHPREVVQPGQRVTLRVIKIDHDRHRLGLSIKRVDSPQYADMDWQHAMHELSEGGSEGEPPAQAFDEDFDAALDEDAEEHGDLAPGEETPSDAAG
jgi:small subunit ribosomal protein S1